MVAPGNTAVDGDGRGLLDRDEAGYPRRGYAWCVVAILVATAILSYTDRQVLSLLVDPIERDFGIGDRDFAKLSGPAFALVYGIAGIALGYLADRASRRLLIFAGVLVWSLGTIACGFAHGFGELFAARVVVGFGEAVLSPAAISVISDYFPPSRRGTAVGCFLSGIAIGIGASNMIGGGVLHAVDGGVLAATPFASLAPWRLVLLAIGAPGLVWALVILLIREPTRRVQPGQPATGAAGARHAIRWGAVAPVYLVVAMASLVDNAVGAWAPSLLIRSFSQNAADVGVRLGVLVAAAFGGGVLAGGWLADRAGARGGWAYKLFVCGGASVLIVPAAVLMNSGQLDATTWSIPLYFALSGIVTACGFSAILDVVPNRSRGLAMAVSFFLNVAVGASVGPLAVSWASDDLFGRTAGLGPAMATTVAGGYGIAIVALFVAFRTARRPQSI